MTAARVALAVALALTLSGCGHAPLSWIPGVSGDAPVPAVDSAETLADLERRSADQPGEPYWPFRMAEVRAGGDDVPAAEEALLQALARDPDHAPSLALLSKLWFETGQHEESVALLEEARARRALPPELTAALALHYDALDRPDLADALVAPLESDLDGSAAGASVLTYLRLRGDAFAEAEETARRALDTRPSAVNHNNYGIAKLYAGEPALAREHFVRAAELDPSLPGPLYNLAIVDRFYRFDDEGARAWLRRYRELSDEDPDALADVLAAKLAGAETR